ncbi:MULTISPECIES: transglycosylase SLT domain-containing protein [Methylomicrobium]|uniref:Soluble lytic murein transglycosylase-like protein n=1 Tax=Methylomicrobium album BG8 TaxID=686340 RepID=H8GQF0_METAL|nr:MULTISPECIES: transglycosylase SLT domain-containing protein [Methylomicrobium]EIC28609.1 soluble lytic murein transglycosylase-like protein [Methylomicrobium album BG8]
MLRWTTILITLSVSGGALADIYKYVDSAGRTYYTNIKPKPANSSLYKRIMETKPYRYMRPAPTMAGYRGYFGRNKHKFSDLINQAAYRHQVDPKLVHAVIQTESAYNAGAVSSAGAVGLMQLMPDTARRYGVDDRRDPLQNVDGGTHYLRDLIEMFSPNLELAVAAYNAGEGAVIKYNYSIPPYPETQNYVKQVLAAYNRSSL